MKFILTILLISSIYSCNKENNNIILLSQKHFPLKCNTHRDCSRDNFGSCLIGICVGNNCYFGHFVDGTLCDDKNPCTTSGECFEGKCIRGIFKNCPPPDPCKEKGVCNTLTGKCTYLNKVNGSSCDDHIWCNGIETCQNGVCISENQPCLSQYCNEFYKLCINKRK